MGEALTALREAVEGTWAIAVAASFVWGVFSVILSPCHLASIPLIVGFIDSQGQMSTRRALAVSSLFASGILVTIAVIGAITAAAGGMVGEVGPAANYVIAAVFFVIGLHMMDVIPAPWSGPGQVRTPRRGLGGALLLGLVFGVALGPCTFAYMIPMLAITFDSATTNPLYGWGLLAAYGLGHCSVIVLAGTSTALVQRYLNWNEESHGAVILKRICGALVLAGGLWLIWIA